MERDDDIKSLAFECMRELDKKLSKIYGSAELLTSAYQNHIENWATAFKNYMLEYKPSIADKINFIELIHDVNTEQCEINYGRYICQNLADFISDHKPLTTWIMCFKESLFSFDNMTYLASQDHQIKYLKMRNFNGMFPNILNFLQTTEITMFHATLHYYQDFLEANKCYLFIENLKLSLGQIEYINVLDEMKWEIRTSLTVVFTSSSQDPFLIKVKSWPNMKNLRIKVGFNSPHHSVVSVINSAVNQFTPKPASLQRLELDLHYKENMEDTEEHIIQVAREELIKLAPLRVTVKITCKAFKHDSEPIYIGETIKMTLTSQ